jgi:ElaB/YqjD/DUF883 family membrane-anchored ribosome-binding protein
MKEALDDKLITQLKDVVRNAEDLLRSSTGQAGEKFAAVRGKLEDSLSAAKTTLHDAEEKLIDSTRDAARDVDLYVHKNPWQSVGIAGAIGLVIGMLISRR